MASNDDILTALEGIQAVLVELVELAKVQNRAWREIMKLPRQHRDEVEGIEYAYEKEGAFRDE